MINVDSISGVNPVQKAGQSAVQTHPTVDGVGLNGNSFEQALKAELNHESSVRISAHAQKRIEARNIPFGANETARLEQAVDKAATKGSRESLILMDDLALVVSIKNRVVITAVDANNRKNDVFTNIDSVVLS